MSQKKVSIKASTQLKAVAKSASNRIMAFDLLRGYFLIVILYNHLAYYPSGLELFTGRGHLYASTAEGFFVLSGIVLGIVRGRKLLNQPFAVAAKLLWKRSFQLYITSIILTLLFTFVGQYFLGNPGLKYAIFTDWDSWPTMLWHTLTLQYTYGWADFLRFYAIFIFFAPFALWLLRKGKWYIMLTLSFIIWTLYPLVEKGSPLSQPLSWQFIFFAGFTIGFYWESITAKWRSLPSTIRKKIGWSMVTAFAITLVASFLLVFGNKFGTAFGDSLNSIHRAIGGYFDKDRLPIPRLLIGTLWLWSLFFIVRRFEAIIIKKLGWLLLPFGMNSLYIYTISAFIVFFAHLAFPMPGFGNIALNLAASLVTLALLWLALRTRFLMKIIPR